MCLYTYMCVCIERERARERKRERPTQILFHYILPIVSYAIQWVSAIYLFYIYLCVSVNPKLLIYPSPFFSPLVTRSLFSLSVSLAVFTIIYGLYPPTIIWGYISTLASKCSSNLILLYFLPFFISTHCSSVFNFLPFASLKCG